jgi:hypothetical protein
MYEFWDTHLTFERSWLARLNSLYLPSCTRIIALLARPPLWAILDCKSRSPIAQSNGGRDGLEERWLEEGRALLEKSSEHQEENSREDLAEPKKR